MKNIFLKILMILGLFSISTSLLAADQNHKLNLCLTGANAQLFPMSDNNQMNEYDFYQVADISCQNVKKIVFGLQTMVTTLSVGAAISTATGAGIPITVGLSVSSAGLSYINFLVGNMDCEQDRSEFQKQVKEAVCEYLADNSNVSCIPKLIQIYDENPSDMICRDSTRI